MIRPSRLSGSPATGLALVALFFALGGSAFAVGERMQGAAAAQQRCANGAVRGVAAVTGGSAGMANVPDRFTGAGALFSRRFNCTGRAIHVRRTGIGIYEVRFVGNAAPTVLASGIGEFSASVEALGGGTFRIRVQNAGRADEADGPFVVLAV